MINKHESVNSDMITAMPFSFWRLITNELKIKPPKQKNKTKISPHTLTISKAVHLKKRKKKKEMHKL